MRKLLTLLLLLVLAVGCNKEEGPAVIEEPAKVEEAVPTEKVLPLEEVIE